MFNSKYIQKELESNHKIVLSDSSKTKKLKDMGYSCSALTSWLKLSKAQIEAREKERKSPVLSTETNEICLNEATILEKMLFIKNGYLQVKSIQSKEQEQTWNAMCFGSFTSRQF